MGLKVGVVGATGVVGETFCQLLEKSDWDIEEYRPFASKRSEGQNISLKGKNWSIQTLKPGCFDGLDLVFFSSGDDISKEWAPQAVDAGAWAIDNSAAFRMSPEHKLVVPEINSHLLNKKENPELIANPNCSTIQLVVALNPLAKAFGLDQVFVSTYQAVSGAGKAGSADLKKQSQEILDNKNVSQAEAFPHTIAFNCLPHIGSFNDEGFCSEEVKIMNETQKILDLPKLPISAFTVRVPVFNGHSEAVFLKLKKSVNKEEIENVLRESEGIEYIPQSTPEAYPHTQEASGTKPVYVGRLHQDPNDQKTWIFWVVADNLLKGAALNGFQIARHIFG